MPGSSQLFCLCPGDSFTDLPGIGYVDATEDPEDFIGSCSGLDFSEVPGIFLVAKRTFQSAGSFPGDGCSEELVVPLPFSFSAFGPEVMEDLLTSAVSPVVISSIDGIGAYASDLSDQLSGGEDRLL